MHAGQDADAEDTPVGGTAVEGTVLPDPVGGRVTEAGTVLGTDVAPSPLAVVEGTTPLLEMDRLDVGTPIADLGTEQISRD